MTWNEILAFFARWQVWAIVIGVALVAYNAVRPIVGRLGITRDMLLWIGVGGVVFTSGILGSLGAGSVVGPGSSTLDMTGMFISDIQVTTSFAGNCTLAQNANQDDLFDVRCTDAQATETTGDTEIGTGVLTVKRSGTYLPPWSCEVNAYSRSYESAVTPGDGNVFNIVERTTLGELEVYLTGAASSTAATTSSQKAKASIPFNEGIDTGYIGVLIEVDEDGHDNLNQYDYRDVVIDLCGTPYTFRIHRM